MGQKDAAIADLNTLRNSRIENHTALQATDFATDIDLLRFCFEKRRREMFRSLTRLFDLKRMSLNPALVKTITHTFQQQTYTIQSDSDKLVLPIPAQVKKFNPSW